MKNLTRVLFASVFICSCIGFVSAQERADSTKPPKILVIQRESLKPGKAGSAHEKTEAAFVTAMAASKGAGNYLAMDAISGVDRSLFLSGYDSFSAWAQDPSTNRTDATLNAALDQAALADGELLSEHVTGVFVYREEESLEQPVKIGQMRCMEVTSFKIKAGHRKEWSDLAKMYKAAYQKSVPEAHWAMYEMMYGTQGDFYLLLTPMKSIGEIDGHMTADDKLMKTMSEADKTKLRELAAASIETSVSNLYMFNPKISYPRQEWVKDDPTFWNSKDVAIQQQGKAGVVPAQ